MTIVGFVIEKDRFDESSDQIGLHKCTKNDIETLFEGNEEHTISALTTKDLICFDDPNQIKFDGNVQNRKSILITNDKCSTDTCLNP